MRKLLLLCNSLILLFSIFSFSKQAEAASFKDINNTFAKPYIEALAQQGIIKGFPDGTYRPNALIKRADFAIMLASALDLPLDEDGSSAKSFTDVPPRALPYVDALVEAGIASGKKPGYFGAELPITRQEMVIMFVRAMGMEEFAHLLYLQSEFVDENKIGRSAYPYISFAEHIGFAAGNNGKFMPLEPGTRAAAAKWIYNFIIEEDKFFQNSLFLIGANTVDNIESVQLINDETVQVEYSDGTTETHDIIAYLEEMHMRLWYGHFGEWIGFDWVDLTESEKAELIAFIVQCWQANWSEYQLLAAPEMVIEKVQQRLNDYFINDTNNEEFLLEQAISAAIEEGLIEEKTNE